MKLGIMPPIIPAVVSANFDSPLGHTDSKKRGSWRVPLSSAESGNPRREHQRNFSKNVGVVVGLTLPQKRANFIFNEFSVCGSDFDQQHLTGHAVHIVLEATTYQHAGDIAMGSTMQSRTNGGCRACIS